MNNQKVTYAELKAHKDSKRQQRKPKESKSSVTENEPEITYTELNLQNASKNAQGSKKQSHCREKVIAGILGFLCLVLVVVIVTIAVTPLEKQNSNNSSQEKSNQKGLSPAYHCKHCPKEWFTYYNSCYYIGKEAKTWNESSKDCTSKKSNLLFIENEKEMNISVTLNLLSWLRCSHDVNNGARNCSDDPEVSSERFPLSTKKQDNCFYLDIFSKRSVPASCSERKTYVCKHHMV